MGKNGEDLPKNYGLDCLLASLLVLRIARRGPAMVLAD
jgi:hypothetical protein